MAQIPIEILTAGDLPGDHLERAILAANTLQSEFNYSLFPEGSQADFRAFVAGQVKDDDALDRIDEARTRDGGYHPFCIGFIDGAIDARDGYTNVFGSDRPDRGLAIFTIANVSNVIIPEERLTAYFLYYLAKASFSFRAPGHINHRDERRCPYDQKVNKLAIVESMRARALCDECRARLRAQPLLTSRQVLALERLFAACGDLLKEDPKEPSAVDSRPSVFIGSSSEGLPIARRLKELLAKDLRMDVWDEGTIFGLGEATLESLEAAVLKYQFGLFVFTPDDQLQSRGQAKTVARDNVLFELGLFAGKLTRRRAFVIRPGGSTISLPSDLAGITTATYDVGNQQVTTHIPRLDAACAAILRAVRIASTSR